MNKKVTGSVIVVLIILAAIASTTTLFGTTVNDKFREILHLQSNYEKAVAHVKSDVDFINSHDANAMIYKGLLFDGAVVDEGKKRIFYRYTMPYVTSESLTQMPKAKLDKMRQDEKERTVNALKDKKDLMVLFKAGWGVEYLTLNGDGATVNNILIALHDVVDDNE